jgi:hypothetical protein
MRLCLPLLRGMTASIFLSSGLAFADSEFTQALWINTGFYTSHFDRDKGLRNANPGLGIEWSLTDTYAFTAGGFKNSDDQHSNYVGVYVMPWRWHSWKAGAVVGVFDGYPRANQGGWFPALIPVLSVEGSQWGLNTAVVPSVKDRLYGGISFQLKYKLTR